MLGILAVAIISQSGAVQSADEIRQRLEQPVTFRSEPTRLPNVLATLGDQVGVRIRCESELNSAIVVVLVKNRPAKEVLQYLMDGVSAGSVIYAGTLTVGMNLISPELEKKRQEGARQTMQQMIDGRIKAAELDKPADSAYFSRLNGIGIASIQAITRGQGYFYQSPEIGKFRSISPLSRLYAQVLQLVGVDPLLMDSDKAVVITGKNLQGEKAQKLNDALEKFSAEHKMLSDGLKNFRTLADRTEGYYDNTGLYQASEPISDAVTGFRLTLSPTQWGREGIFEILSGGQVVTESTEYLPKNRHYVPAVGEPYNGPKDGNADIKLGPKVQRFYEFRRFNQDGKPKAFDYALAREFSDAWKNEPLSFTPSQALPEIAIQENMNMIAYLSDTQLMSNLYVDSSVKEFKINATQLFSRFRYGSYLAGMRKKDTWILGYTQDPEMYLNTQVDRKLLTEMLKLAMRPGPLNFEQSAKFAKGFRPEYWYWARAFANLVRPGFESLNPYNIEVLDLLGKLTSSQMASLTGRGLSISALPADLERKLRRFTGGGRAYPSNGIPADSVDSPATAQEYRKGTVKITKTSQQGLLAIQGSDDGITSFNSYPYFYFNSFERFRGISPQGFNPMNYISSKICWPARMDTISLVVEIPRKRSITVQTMQYVADVSQSPLAENQILPAIAKYFGD